MLPQEAAKNHPKEYYFRDFFSTLIPLTSASLFPPFCHFQKMGLTWDLLGRYLGGTWEEHGRNVFVSPSLLLCFPFDAKAKFYRRESEVLSNIYRTSIEHLSKTYRTSIEDLSNIYRRSIEHLSKIYRRPIEDLSKTYRTSIEDLSKIYRRPIEHLSNRACGNLLMPLFLQSLSVALIY